MKISEFIKHLEYLEDTYGNLNIVFGKTKQEDMDFNFTYFQVNKEKELFIIDTEPTSVEMIK